MKYTIFLSTDGKHTVQVEGSDPEDKSGASLELAMVLYDQILEKYGTKQEQTVKAYAKKTGFPEDEGPVAQEPIPGIPVCPIHKKPMTPSQFGGFYCKTKDPTQPKGWCTYKSK